MADNFVCMKPVSPLPPPTSPSWLHAEVARRMGERLGLITVPVTEWAAWGLARGAGLTELQARYPHARGRVFEASAAEAEAMRQRVQAASGWRRWLPAALADRQLGRVSVQTPETSPPRGGGDAAPVQLVWANLMLDDQAGVEAAKALLKTWHAQLAVGGFVMFTCFGPDTARELRALAQAQGWLEAPGAAAGFTDMHDWGDRLVSEGFADPVMDMEQLTLTYADGPSLVRDLQELGWAAHVGGARGLRALEALPGGGEAWRALGATVRDGRFVLTVELVYGHAFKPAPRLKLAGETRFSVDELRASLASPSVRATGRNPRQ